MHSTFQTGLYIEYIISSPFYAGIIIGSLSLPPPNNRLGTCVFNYYPHETTANALNNKSLFHVEQAFIVDRSSYYSSTSTFQLYLSSARPYWMSCKVSYIFWQYLPTSVP